MDERDPFSKAFKEQRKFGDGFNARVAMRNRALRGGYKSVTKQEAEGKTIMDMKAFMSQVFNEPEAAERGLGLIREFHINVSDILAEKEVDEKMLYSISISYRDSEGKEIAYTTSEAYMLERRNGKYYNGNKKVFIGKDDFHQVKVSFYDPYKGANKREEGQEEEAGDKNPHPDGIYLQAVYKQNAGVLDDPFRREHEDESVEGFNVLMQEETMPLRSLSLHKKKLLLRGMGRVVETITSGVMTPKSEIRDANGAYRANVLFTWRGDNLVIARKLDEKKLNEMDENGLRKEMQLVSLGESHEESDYVGSKLFKTDEYLINDSMPQLKANGKKKAFYLRTTSPLDHYIPATFELDAAKEEHLYVLTAEELMKDEKPIVTTDFEVDNQDALPVKAAMVLGTHTYGNSYVYIDNSDHLVLDTTQGEGAEIRYIHPPQIKWEDFKILGYLSPEKLRGTGPFNRTIFINRCVELEKRGAKAIPEKYATGTLVGYLADPRFKGFHLVATDAFTARQMGQMDRIKPYLINKAYPYYSSLYPMQVKVKRLPDAASLSFSGDKSAMQLNYGVYNFKLVSMPETFSGTASEKLQQYNSVPLKVSVVSHPLQPVLKATKGVIATRLSEAQLREEKWDQSLQNFWHIDLPFEKGSDTWKSMKYLEETISFKLPEKNSEFPFEEVRQSYLKQFELLEDELPYEAFLVREGSFAEARKKKKGLLETLWPSSITLTFTVGAAARKKLQNVGELQLFSFRLNEHTEIKAYLNSDPYRYCLYVGDRYMDGNADTCTLFFDKKRSEFAVRYEKQTEVLSKPPYPNLTMNDMKVPEQVLDIVQHDAGSKFDMSRSHDFVLFSDLRSKFYKEKVIKPMASSIFQAYFPKKETEFDTGSFAAQELNVEIPNNVRPAKPLVDVRLLLKRTVQAKYDQTGSKTNTIAQVAQLLLDEDFCNESPNIVGIVLNKMEVSKETNKYKLVNYADDICEVGEDITKVVKQTKWRNRTMLQLIERIDLPLVFSKYFPEKDLRHYKVGDAIYEVLVAKPFFNRVLRKWQVLIPLRYFEVVETMFLKFVVMKIAKGHSVKIVSAENNKGLTKPYMEDVSQTNLSLFSRSEHLPVYTIKSFKVIRVQNGYVISNGSKSQYDNKVYFATILKEHYILEHRMIYNGVNMKQIDFKAVGVIGKEKGNTLMFNGREEIEIISDKRGLLVIQEFEIHSNLWIKQVSEKPDSDEDHPSMNFIRSGMQFVDFDPLFEVEGLRLINSLEFDL